MLNIGGAWSACDDVSVNTSRRRSSEAGPSKRAGLEAFAPSIAIAGAQA